VLVKCMSRMRFLDGIFPVLLDARSASCRSYRQSQFRSFCYLGWVNSLKLRSHFLKGRMPDLVTSAMRRLAEGNLL
jgi:hypothetical protein